MIAHRTPLSPWTTGKEAVKLVLLLFLYTDYVNVIMWLLVVTREGNCARTLNARSFKRFQKKRETRTEPRQCMNYPATHLMTWSQTLLRFSSGLNSTPQIMTVSPYSSTSTMYCSVLQLGIYSESQLWNIHLLVGKMNHIGSMVTVITMKCFSFM